MATERRENSGNPSPHFDGKSEGPINDAAGGPTYGIRSDNQLENSAKRNPLNLRNNKNKDTEKIDQIIDGKMLEDEKY